MSTKPDPAVTAFVDKQIADADLRRAAIENHCGNIVMRDAEEQIARMRKERPELFIPPPQFSGQKNG
jgi:hypothetical protein